MGGWINCPTCDGAGCFETKPNRDYPDGSYRWTQFKDCETCGGSGKIHPLAEIPELPEQQP